MDIVPRKIDAIRAIMGKGKVSQLSDNEYNYKGNTPPSDEAIQTKWDELKAEYDAQEYARKRQASYPSIGDELDMLMKDMRDNTTTHQESCEAVKAKYPKPS